MTHCKARGTGGAIYAQGMLLAQHIRCSHCNAPTSGCLQLDHGETSIGSLTFDSDSRLLPASPVNVAAGAGANMTLGRVDCREAPGCTLAVAKMRLARLLCQRGEKRQSLADSDGAECKECPAGEIRLVAVDEAREFEGVCQVKKHAKHSHSQMTRYPLRNQGISAYPTAPAKHTKMTHCTLVIYL